MKKLLLLCFLLFFSACAFGQAWIVTSVSGTNCSKPIGVTGQGIVGISITGSWTGTIQPQLAVADDPYQNVNVYPYGSTTPQSTITANGIYQSSSVSGGSTFQVCGNTVTGTASVKLTVSTQSASVKSAASGAIPTGTAAYTLYYSAPTTLAVNSNPLISLAFPNGSGGAGNDRAKSMHDCLLTAVNSVLGDQCDMRGELGTSIPIFSNIFPTYGDNASSAGTALLPSGRLNLCNGQWFSPLTTGFTVQGTGPGGSNVGATQFSPGNNWVSAGCGVGSGGTYNPVILTLGPPSWSITNSPLPGPYSTHIQDLDADCFNRPGLFALGQWTGQDNTWWQNIKAANCPGGFFIGGSKATTDGIDIRHGYFLQQNPLCIANTGVNDGGTPWTAGAWTSTQRTNVPAGVGQYTIVVMNAPTGGTGGNASGAAFLPGVGYQIGTASGGAGTGGQTGWSAEPNGLGGTVLNNTDGIIGATADIIALSGGTCTWTAGVGTVNTIGSLSCTGVTNDLKPDAGAQLATPLCSLAALTSNNLNPFSNAASGTSCYQNSLIYMNGIAAAAYTFLNGLTGLVTDTTATSFTAVFVSGTVSQTATLFAAGTAGYAQSVDPRISYVANGSGFAAPFTTAGQIAFVIPSTANDTSNGNGSIVAFTTGLNIYGPTITRGIDGLTVVGTQCVTTNSQSPLHELSLSGNNLGRYINNHWETSWGAGIKVGDRAVTAGVIFDANTLETNDGYYANGGGGSQQPSSESAGILLDNRWGFVKNATVWNNTCSGGLNSPTVCVADKNNHNMLTPTNTGIISEYMTDGSGTLGGAWGLVNVVDLLNASCTYIDATTSNANCNGNMWGEWGNAFYGIGGGAYQFKASDEPITGAGIAQLMVNNNNTLNNNQSVGIAAFASGTSTGSVPLTAASIGSSNGDLFQTYTGGTLNASSLQYSGGTKQWSIKNNGVVGTVASLATAGVGNTTIRVSTLQKAETQAADASVATLTPPPTAGLYRVCYYADVSAATSATIGFTLTYRDSNANNVTAQALPLTQGGTAAPALTFTTSAISNYGGCLQISINNAQAAITLAWVGGGTSAAAKVSGTIEWLN